MSGCIKSCPRHVASTAHTHVALTQEWASTGHRLCWHRAHPARRRTPHSDEQPSSFESPEFSLIYWTLCHNLQTAKSNKSRTAATVKLSLETRGIIIWVDCMYMYRCIHAALPDSVPVASRNETMTSCRGRARERWTTCRDCLLAGTCTDTLAYNSSS